MISRLDKAARQALLTKRVNELMEEFDAVQILTSCASLDGGTDTDFAGGGNWYARQGMCHEFIQRDQSKTAALLIAEEMPHPPPEEGESWKDANE